LQPAIRWSAGGRVTARTRVYSPLTRFNLSLSFFPYAVASRPLVAGWERRLPFTLSEQCVNARAAVHSCARVFVRPVPTAAALIVLEVFLVANVRLGALVGSA